MGQFTLFLSVLSLGVACWMAWFALSFFRVEFPRMKVLGTEFPVIQYSGQGQPIEVLWKKKRPAQWARLSEISKPAVAAILVSEDWAFYQHHGYDPNQIVEAMKKDFQDKKFSRGASTITQQVVRNVFLNQNKNLWRKLKEVYLATQLEEEVGKSRILEVYLNIAEWGQGIYGIQSASQFYFGKNPDVLTAKEGAFLAMLLPSPKRYSVSFRAKKMTPFAQKTLESILIKMTQAGYLTEEELQIEISRPLPFL